MRDVIHRQVGAMRIRLGAGICVLCRYDVCYMMCYAMYAMQDGQTGRRKISWYVLRIMGKKQAIMLKTGNKQVAFTSTRFWANFW